MASRGLMVVATLTLAAAIFMSTSEACQPQSAQEVRSGSFHWPEGGEDGLYVETVGVDEQGVEQREVKYLGKFEGNTTLDGGHWAKELAIEQHLDHHNYSRPAGLGGRKLLQDTGVVCTYGILDSIETLDAVLGLARWFGFYGRVWNQYHTVSYTSGCTVAFACNYGGDQYYQFTVAREVVIDNTAISRTCGNFAAGKYSHESAMNSFGRTFVGGNLCR